MKSHTVYGNRIRVVRESCIGWEIHDVHVVFCTCNSTKETNVLLYSLERHFEYRHGTGLGCRRLAFKLYTSMPSVLARAVYMKSNAGSSGNRNKVKCNIVIRTS